MWREMGVPMWWPAVALDPAPAAPSPAPVPAPIPQHQPVREAKAVPVRVEALDAEWPDLPALEAAVRGCTRCALASQRQCAVPGMGDARPDWLVVGEAPGEEEDRQGLPFVGRSGQLLDRMLAAMGLSRERKVYIANAIKCRPPMNRNPEPQELAQCRGYLLRQVALLQPRIVLVMGRFAAQTLLVEGGALSPDVARQIPLGKLRGRVHTLRLPGLDQALPAVVTYHPAYLLRSPAEKAKAWADLCLAMDTLDQRRPSSMA
jgi:uracil-DNA glycosylase